MFNVVLPIVIMGAFIILCLILFILSLKKSEKLVWASLPPFLISIFLLIGCLPSVINNFRNLIDRVSLLSDKPLNFNFYIPMFVLTFSSLITFTISLLSIIACCVKKTNKVSKTQTASKNSVENEGQTLSQAENEEQITLTQQEAEELVTSQIFSYYVEVLRNYDDGAILEYTDEERNKKSEYIKNNRFKLEDLNPQEKEIVFYRAFEKYRETYYKKNYYPKSKLRKIKLAKSIVLASSAALFIILSFINMIASIAVLVCGLIATCVLWGKQSPYCEKCGTKFKNEFDVKTGNVIVNCPRCGNKYLKKNVYHNNNN